MRRDIFGNIIEETDEEFLARLEYEAELAEKAYADMLEHCDGCDFFKHGSCWRDIDEYSDCVRN